MPSSTSWSSWPTRFSASRRAWSEPPLTRASASIRSPGRKPPKVAELVLPARTRSAKTLPPAEGASLAPLTAATVARKCKAPEARRPSRGRKRECQRGDPCGGEQGACLQRRQKEAVPACRCGRPKAPFIAVCLLSTAEAGRKETLRSARPARRIVLAYGGDRAATALLLAPYIGGATSRLAESPSGEPPRSSD